MTDSNFQWPGGKRAALSLSFDDARFSQLDRGIPLLNEHGVRATFYLSLLTLEQRIPEWKQAIADGHEMGNHTVRHACSGNFPWQQQKPLEEFTLEEMEEELVQANARIEEMLGVTPATFAYPCGQTFVGRGENLKSYIPLVAKHFLAGRNFRAESANNPAFCDLAFICGVDGDVISIDALKSYVDQAIEHGAWLTFAFHDVAGEPARQTITEATLAALCNYANDEANGVWVDTIANIASYLQSNRPAL